MSVFKYASQYLWLVIPLVFSACEKEIDFKLNEASPKLVVEAIIEDEKTPTVVLTRSMNYFGSLSPEMLRDAFVRNAVVTISDGSESRVMREYADTVFNDLILYHYSIDTINEPPFKGKQGGNYSLSISVNNDQYTASTTIPRLLKTMDSIWWKPAPNNPDTSLVVVMGKFTDPEGFGNYIRYFTRVGDSAFLPGFTSVFDDQIVDGTSYDFQVDKGVNRNAEIEFENYAYFRKGDTVTIKFCNIDKATYDFWRTLEFSYSSIGNPFSSPTKVMSNISGDALGYFGGYAVQYVTLVIPE